MSAVHLEFMEEDQTTLVQGQSRPGAAGSSELQAHGDAGSAPTETAPARPARKLSPRFASRLKKRLRRL
ncbi:MAG: hypothetical protein AB1896_07605 [Thermodesulfobacteriota bacterium]